MREATDHEGSLRVGGCCPHPKINNLNKSLNALKLSAKLRLATTVLSCAYFNEELS